MKIIVLTIAVVALGLSGCEDASDCTPRFVEQEKVRSEFIDFESVDDAVQVQAKIAMGGIVRTVKMKLMKDYNGNFSKLSSALGNKNGTELLSKLGLKAGLLDGSFYKTSDFHFTFSGGKMHVTALKEQGNTRGHFKESFRIS